MYIPFFKQWLKTLDLDETNSDDAGLITIPARVFKLLVKAVISGKKFDYQVYFKANFDARRAAYQGEIKNDFDHYEKFGYFEGRNSGPPDVDERLYTERYTRIAAGMRDASIQSAEGHFYMAGAADRRSMLE